MSEEQLLAEIAALRAEVAELRQSVPGSRAPRTAPTESRGSVSRRSLLIAPAAVALAGVAASQLMGASPAAADDGDPLILGSEANQSQSNTVLTLYNASDFAIYAAPEGLGDGGNVTFDLGGDDPQVVIWGGLSAGPGLGIANTGLQSNARAYAIGVDTISEAGHALSATTTDHTSTQDTVVINNPGHGRSLYGHSSNTANSEGSVTGVNAGSGAGVWGTANTGDAVVGVSTHGRGGRFRGEDAAINLTPSTAASHPTTGTRGDLFVDASMRLWFCTRSWTALLVAHWVRVV
jgi:hypothetical protein